MHLGVVVVVVILALVYAYYRAFSVGSAKRYQASSGDWFHVQPFHKQPQQAANVMAALDENLIEILRHVQNKLNAGRYSKRQAAFINRCLYLYDPKILVENSPRNFASETSYSVEKGGLLAICLRNAGGKFHDFSTLQYVLLHELSHIGLTVEHHPPEFWRAFKFLLGEAAESGHYKPVDYSKTPVKYCGELQMEHNTLYDPSIEPFA
jgi:hypothetical protein